MKYICDENHKRFFFGVTYVTSLWQVGDSAEQNVTYNICLVKEKNDIINFWIEHMIGKMELIPTDTITIINKVWLNLFDEVESNNKYITE